MRISKLELNNIGVFDRLEMEFKPKLKENLADIHILTGVNGTGKSTILYALSGAIEQSSIEKRFRNDESSVIITFDQIVQSSEAVVRYTGLDIEELVSRKKKEEHKKYDNKENLSIEDVINFHQNLSLIGDIRVNNPSPPNYIYDFSELKTYRNLYQGKKDINKHIFEFAFLGYSPYRSVSSSKIQSVEEITGNLLENTLNLDIPSNSKLLEYNSKLLGQWITNTKIYASLHAERGEYDKEKKYNEAIKNIENAINKIVGEEYKIEFVFKFPPFKVKIQINNEELEFDVLPDGLKSIISWISDFLIRMDRLKWIDDCNVLDRNFILLIDEIDIHLHPEWQRTILPVIQKLFRNAQIFVTTHSPFVVGSIDNAWIYKLELENGKGILKETVEAKTGTSYPAIVDEIFGIDNYFDIQTQKEFEKFYSYKDELLGDNKKNYEKFLKLSRKLAKKSLEVEDIVLAELRQLKRMTGEEIKL